MSETFELGTTRLQVAAATPEVTVLAAELQPGGGSGWHTHTREDETLIVTSGTLVVDDGTRRELEAGDVHVLPRGRRHAFANERDDVVRLYFVCTPGGLEQFFRALVAGDDPDAAAARAGLIFG